jgi:subtilisin family serine protease
MPHMIRSLLAGLALAFVGGAAWAATTTSVIVELQGEPGAVWKARQTQQGATVSDAALAAYRAQLTTAQNQVITRIAAAGIPAAVATVTVPGATGLPTAVQRRYTLVYNGFTLTVPPADVARLRGVAGVKDVHRVRLPRIDLDRSVPFIRAPELYGGVPELNPFDDLREGYEGQGIVISVIDSGVEWQHEMFGSDLTPPRLGLAPANPLVPTNKKIVYNLPMMDWVVEDGIGHGTHVATTAAGYLGFEPGGDGVPTTADDVPVHGVAPQAKLMSYKVCSDTLFAANVAGSVVGVGLIGECLGDIVLALEDSVSPRTLTGFPKPVAQVINMSLGSTFGQPDDPTAAAASNAALMGAIVVAAAGNSGDVPGVVGSPSVGTHVISVGNATDPGSAANWFVDAGARTDIVTFPMAGTPSPAPGGISQPFVYVKDSLTAADYPAAVTGRIALIENGAVVGLFAEFANNAALAGAVAALLIGDTENATAVKATIPAAIIKPDDAQYLLSLIGPNPQHGDVSPAAITLKGAVGQFLTAMNGSSSRGPVIGLGQVKPDLSAPGTNILAGVPPTSVIGAITTDDGLTYGTISGTSMASPHVAGAAAQVKQANPTWTPDMVRTALINTSTPMRDAAGVPDTFGTQNPKIHAQGGGYVDVLRAARAKALMGVAGDGIAAPGILGSHSFGASPVINNQCTNSQSVQVTIRDLRGAGGVYTLSVADNRELSHAGVSASVSPSSVSVPAGGSATFTATVTVDGAVVTEEPQLDIQWFVVADRTDGSERLSMPFFYRAAPSAPAGSGGTRVETEIREGTLGLGSSAAGQGEQSVDVPVEVAGGTFRLAGLLESDEVTNAGYPDLDLELYDPSGNLIDSSGVPGGVESVDVAVTVPGTYIFRVINFINAGGSFTLTVDKHIGASVGAAALAAIATEYTEQAGDRVDFDGSFTLAWTGVGGETGYRVERSAGGGAWTEIAHLDGATTTLAVSGLSDGQYAFRVRSEFPGALCTYIEQPGNTQAVQVDHRVEFVAENVDVVVTEASLQNGVFEALTVLTNNSATALLNPVSLEIIGIDSPTGDVRVINADNNGGGTSPADVAIFSYAGPVLGEELSPGETSWARMLRFADPSNVLFSFEARVRAYRRP